MPAQEAKKTPGDLRILLLILLKLEEENSRKVRTGSESDLGTVKVGKNWCH